MGILYRKAIHCPKRDDHPSKKILLLLGDEEINIFCKEHKWLRIELLKNGKPIDFKCVTSRISEIKEDTYFDLSPIPGIATGEFLNKRKCKCPTKV